MTFYFIALTQQMVGEYLTFFQNNTRSKFTIAKIHNARVLDFCLPTIRPFQKIFFKESRHF